MSTTDDARLDALDRRARAAARTLLNDLAAEVPDGADSGDTPTPIVRLDAAAGRRRWSLVAAAVTLLAVVGGAVAVLSRDDGGPDVLSQTMPGYLLPSRLPAGLEPTRAIDFADNAQPDGIRGDIAIYGDSNAADPWATALAVIHLVADEAALGDPSDGETVTVAGHDATLRETESPLGFALSSGEGWELEWPVDDGRLQVRGAMTRDEILAAAETATTEPAVDASGLPDGYAEVARGPIGATDPTLFSVATDRSGLAVTYTAPSEGDEAQEMVAVIQRPAPASAVDLLRAAFPDADEITLRGRHAVVGERDGTTAIQWAEPEGQLVTVVGFGVTTDVVVQVADDLRPARPDEVAALLADHAPDPLGEFGDAPDRSTVVAEGETSTGRWRVLADTTMSEGMEGLTIERATGSSSSSGTSSGMSGGDAPGLELATDTEDGTTIVYGVVPADTASVTFDAPGIQGALEFHEVEGWDSKVIAANITADLPSDIAADVIDAVTIVARGADGRELGRQTVAVEHDPFPPDDAAPGDIVEACTTLPDGSEQCTFESETSATIEAAPAAG